MIPPNLSVGIKPCPKCQAPATHLTAKPLPPQEGARHPRWRIQCDVCKYEGQTAAFIGGAISLWGDENPAAAAAG